MKLKTTYAIGIDIGGSGLKCGVVDQSGSLLYYFIFPIDQTYSQGEVIALIVAAIRKCAAQAPGPITGVGIGFPGIVQNNVIIGGGDNMPDFLNIDLGDQISASARLPVVVDNDVNMMAIGENLYGAASGCSDVVFLTIGTGIGGSLIINSQPYGGYRNLGGELGHLPIVHDGKACACGGIGCLEAYASVSALVKRYAELHQAEVSDEFNGKMIVNNYLAGEPRAIAAMHEHLDYLSTGIAGLVNIFSPQKVVIGGGISEAGKFYVEEITHRVKQKAIPVCVTDTEIVAAALGNRAGVLGCAAKVFAQ
jgi:glucokinase